MSISTKKSERKMGMSPGAKGVVFRKRNDGWKKIQRFTERKADVTITPTKKNAAHMPDFLTPISQKSIVPL